MLIERYEYDAYGKPTIFDNLGQQIPSSTIGNFYMFTSRQFDAETGLYYYRARYYDAVTGRFLQRDPLGYVDGMGLYEYAKSHPLMFIDPTGEDSYDNMPSWSQTWWEILKDPVGTGRSVAKQSAINAGVSYSHVRHYAVPLVARRIERVAKFAVIKSTEAMINAGRVSYAFGGGLIMGGISVAYATLEYAVYWIPELTNKIFDPWGTADPATLPHPEARRYFNSLGKAAAEANKELWHDRGFFDSLKYAKHYYVGGTAKQSAKRIGLKVGEMATAYVTAMAIKGMFKKKPCPTPTSGKPNFKYDPKISKQMKKRGWNDNLIEDTIARPNRTVRWQDTRYNPKTGIRNAEPATAYIRRDGSYVVRNNRSGDIVQVSDRFKSDWKAPWDSK